MIENSGISCRETDKVTANPDMSGILKRVLGWKPVATAMGIDPRYCGSELSEWRWSWWWRVGSSDGGKCKFDWLGANLRLRKRRMSGNRIHRKVLEQRRINKLFKGGITGLYRDDEAAQTHLWKQRKHKDSSPLRTDIGSEPRKGKKESKQRFNRGKMQEVQSNEQQLMDDQTTDPKSFKTGTRVKEKVVKEGMKKGTA
ncbi:hypothetical protein PPACK8108_LOCUS7415 [Phakopsora pachyrhizi]|uniref:Uncharacterized protein n=1 Tax=Phakopsora pachyrhizi TaxID=170000 RepID=A0AAV0AT74_PHAPC|nr:hypothetical protein PPACK8108_LOCUS7415 [Phakopsora pachyrhizi]